MQAHTTQHTSSKAVKLSAHADADDADAMPDRCQTDARQTVHYAVWRRKLPTLLQATQTEEASIKQNEYDAVNAVNAVNTVNAVT